MTVTAGPAQLAPNSERVTTRGQISRSDAKARYGRPAHASKRSAMDAGPSHRG